LLSQVDLLPRFMREDGEIHTTPEFRTNALTEAGFAETSIIATAPAELYNRVIVATKAA
jgi:hypothetical protein